MNTKYNQGGGTPPFLDDIGLERQWADDTVQFLDDKSGFIRSNESFTLTKKRPQALPTRRSSIDGDLGRMLQLTERLSLRITSPQRGVCRLTVCTGSGGLIAVIAASLGSSTATTLGS